MDELKDVILYTDGACQDNPGPGGYAALLRYGGHCKELSGGYRRTTNNRMELMAVIAGLRALKTRCAVRVHSDSRYVVDGIMKGWARAWRARGWRRKGGTTANADLWAVLLELCERHEATFIWVRGHAGDPDNERCDQLAQAATSAGEQAVDEGYEAGPSAAPAEPSLFDAVLATASES
jgi:ribonuclease HI